MADKVFFYRSKDDALHLKKLKRKVDDTLRLLPRKRLIFAHFKVFLLPGLNVALYVFALFNVDKVLLYFIIYGSMGLLAVLALANDYLKGHTIFH